MKLSRIFLIVAAIFVAAWVLINYWFWAPAALTTYNWVFWVGLLGALAIVGALFFYKNAMIANLAVIVTVITAIVLLGFHLWVLYWDMDLAGILWWEVVDIINLMFTTINVWGLPVIMLIFAAVTHREIKIASGKECPAMMEICRVR